jgi:hypothetical protein
LELAEVDGLYNETIERIEGLERQRNQVPINERPQIDGQIATAQESLIGLKSRRDLLQKRKEDEIVRAPIDGTVTTWDVQQKLFGRPVDVGDVLMTIAQTDGDWELEVKMPEHRIGDVSEAKAMFDKAGEPMVVKYVLASNPKHDYQDNVSTISLTADGEGEQGSFVKMRVPISAPSREALGNQLRPGTSAKAKAHCGRRAVGYVLFRDLVNFVHQRILFKFF